MVQAGFLVSDPKSPQTLREQALADPQLPPVLKLLAERIIPEKRHEELRALLDNGLDPLMICDTQPLLSPVSQIFVTPAEDVLAWLKILFEKHPEKMLEAKCPCTGFRYGRFSTDPNVREPYYNNDVEVPLLLAVLASRTETPVTDLTRINAGALALCVPDRHGNDPGQPLLHSMLQSKEFSIATLDKLEELTGGNDFLFLKNSRGETLFHRIVSNYGTCEDITRLDAASWMLQRKPGLVNEPDRFGWTPLDRMLSQAQGRLDTSMGRLMIASGARLEKQIAPQFNLAAVLEERANGRIEKPVPRKPAVLSNAL